MFSTFQFTWEAEKQKIQTVMTKFKEYCKPRRNIPFERYLVNKRVQEPVEFYEQYRAKLRKMAEDCEFDNIIPDEILRDRLVFGIRVSKVRESGLTLKKTDEICSASESMQKPMKIVGDKPELPVNPVSKGKYQTKKKEKGVTNENKECKNCGQHHDTSRRENCRAYLKTCRKCGKVSHWVQKCRSSRHDSKVKSLEDFGEVECFGVTSSELDDSQLITLKLESRKYLRFRPDTGAIYNNIPLDLYKKATGDFKLEHVEPDKTKISAYGGGKVECCGTSSNPGVVC